MKVVTSYGTFKQNTMFNNLNNYKMEGQIIKNAINDAINKGLNHYNSIIQNNGVQHFEIPINCSDLVDYNSQNIEGVTRKHDLPESLKVSFFRKFDSLTPAINEKSCLYFFEFENGLSELIYNEYKFFKTSNADRNKSGLKNNPHFNTNILYVGKVKKGLGARLSTHFGYANSQTGGLQLKYWAKQINLKLTVHILVFQENICDFINPLELELTKSLKPLIGKSK